MRIGGIWVIPANEETTAVNAYIKNRNSNVSFQRLESKEENKQKPRKCKDMVKLRGGISGIGGLGAIAWQSTQTHRHRHT